MCKGFKKFLKVIATIIAICGAAAAVYYAVKKYLARKECESCEDFVPCECCDCEECNEEAAPEATAPAAEEEKAE
ncbi:MAG: hypothetical protein K6F09_04535 [Clostridiales bacterium]|nr:hypothetical protein [Clostridiales bacterium]